MPPLVIQISDLHMGAEWPAGDAAACLARAVDAVNRFPTEPAAVLVTGDLAGVEEPALYEQARELLSELRAPFHVLPGNHDLRAPMRSCFGIPGEGEDPVQYAFDAGPLRVVMLDTLVSGSDAGSLDGGRLEWLAAELAGPSASAPTLIALHHPPIAIGIPVWEEIALAPADREALERLVASNPQVVGLVAGHLHRAVFSQLGGRPVFVASSVYEQSKLDLGLTDFEMCDDPPAFAVHTLVEGRLVSHLQPF